MTEIFTVGKELIKTYENAEKSVSQIKLIRLTAQMILKLVKINWCYQKTRLETLILSGYDKLRLHFANIKKKKNGTITLFENPKFSIDDKTAQILDAKKK